MFHSMFYWPLVSLSFAEPSSSDALMAPEQCAVVQVSVTSPAPLATGVPVDVMPAALLSAGGCGSQSWQVTLVDASTGATVATAAHAESDGKLIELELGGDLAPETTYTFRIEPLDGVGELAEIGFTTGTGTTVGLDGAPAILSSAASWSEDVAVTTVQVEIDVAPAAEGASIVAFGGRDEGDLAWTSATGPTTVLLQGSRSDGSAPAKVCLTARQRDLAGRWTVSDEDCVAPEVIASPGGGCFGGGSRESTTPALGGLLLAAGLLRRSRR